MIWTFCGRYDPAEANHGEILRILQPLMAIYALNFEVEVNIHLPQVVDDVLEGRPFELIVHERPYNWLVFPA